MGNTAQRAATSIRGLAAHFRAPASYRMSAADRSLLRCPRCSAPLSSHRLTLQCAHGHRFPVVDGVPVFTEVGTRVEKRPLEHQSHQAPPDLVEAFRGYESWLHLGAGATAEVLPGPSSSRRPSFATPTSWPTSMRCPSSTPPWAGPSP